MARNKTIPKFSSHEEAAGWLDTHSTAYIKTTPAEFELSPNFRVRIIDNLDEAETLIAIDQPLSKQISEIAQTQGISIEILVNRWLREKVSENVSLASA
ncbi:MAG: hypothetical protein ACREOI_15380 [bacterium]